MPMMRTNECFATPNNPWFTLALLKTRHALAKPKRLPPMIAPLYELLGEHGETQEAQEILSGAFDFPALEID